MESKRDILEILIQRAYTRYIEDGRNREGQVIKYVDKEKESIEDGDNLILSLVDLDDSKA